MGRANRLLAARVTTIATGFRTLAKLDRASAEQDHFHRQSGTPGGDRGRRHALRGAGRRRTTASPGVRRQPGRPCHGRDRAAGDRAPCRRACARGCNSCSRCAPKTSTTVRATYDAPRHRRRVRAVLQRSAGAHGRRPSRRLALRRLYRGRTVRHRPARHPGAAAACARPGPVRQCRRAGGSGRRHPSRAARFHARSGWPTRSPRLPPIRRGLPRMAQGRQIRRHRGCRRAAGRSGDEDGGAFNARRPRPPAPAAS